MVLWYCKPVQLGTGASHMRAACLAQGGSLHVHPVTIIRGLGPGYAHSQLARKATVANACHGVHTRLQGTTCCLAIK